MCLSSPFVGYWCVLVQTVLGVNLHPIGRGDDAPLLWTETCVFWYAIGWYRFHRHSCTHIQGGKGSINPFQPWVRCKAKSGPVIYWYGFSLTFLFSNSAHFKYYSAKYWGQLILGFNIKYSRVYEMYCIWFIPLEGGGASPFAYIHFVQLNVLCTVYVFTYVFSSIELTIWN